MKRFEGPKGQMFGGAQAVGCFSLNIGKLERRRDFSHSKTCKLLLVRGTILFYKPETASFACWRKCYVECINVIK